MDDEADVLGRFMYLMDQYDRKEKDNYISLMSEYYQSKIRDIQKKDGNHVKQEENLVLFCLIWLN